MIDAYNWTRIAVLHDEVAVPTLTAMETVVVDNYCNFGISCMREHTRQLQVESFWYNSDKAETARVGLLKASKFSRGEAAQHSRVAPVLCWYSDLGVRMGMISNILFLN